MDGVNMSDKIEDYLDRYKEEMGQVITENEFISVDSLRRNHDEKLRHFVKRFVEKFSTTTEDENLYFQYRDKLIGLLEEDFQRLGVKHQSRLEDVEKTFGPLIKKEVDDFKENLPFKAKLSMSNNFKLNHFQRQSKIKLASVMSHFAEKHEGIMTTSLKMYVLKRLEDALNAVVKEELDIEEQQILQKIKDYNGDCRTSTEECVKWFVKLYEMRLPKIKKDVEGNATYQAYDDLWNDIILQFDEFLCRFRRHNVMNSEAAERLRSSLKMHLNAIFDQEQKLEEDPTGVPLTGSIEEDVGKMNIPLAFAVSGTRKTVDKPEKRVSLCLPCPGSGCNREEVYSWTCKICLALFEWGFNKLVYCECGQTPASLLRFKCVDPKHGFEFKTYDKDDDMQKKLDLLSPRRDINILILGETGVGKSTWINAFANFQNYGSLQEAEANDLVTLIPTQFTITDENFQQIVVSTGEDENEIFKKGQSATQEAKIYRFEEGNTTVRLIDTPGIGDTRGIQQDHINLKNILDTLEGLNELHGICILLKPNNARVSIVFRFCVKELLTHLHRDASKNIMFCFTNSRGTFYRPGDTMPALQSLLKENKDVQIALNKDTVYCYDSEAYRFLAAVKNDPPVTFKSKEHENFTESWDTSVSETRRMMEYIRTLTAHPIKSTVNLNHARSLVVKLTRPLAEISRNIQTNKVIIQEERDRIQRATEDIQNLTRSLMTERTEIEVTKIPHPKTVCANRNCVNIRKINDKVSHTEYRQICHARCYLKNVTQDSIGDPALMKCDAMINNMCRRDGCGHSYREHLHIYYDSRQVVKVVEDQSVKEALAKNLSAKELKQKLIESKNKLIAEYEQELKLIQGVSVKFAFFLKSNSITPYNDTMEDYLEHLIHEEKQKVSVGGNRGTLELLQNAVSSYKEERDILVNAMETGIEETGSFSPKDIQVLVNQLKSMKHSGESLKNALECVTKTSYVVQQQAVVVPQQRRWYQNWGFRVGGGGSSASGSGSSYGYGGGAGGGGRIFPRGYYDAFKQTVMKPTRWFMR